MTVTVGANDALLDTTDSSEVRTRVETFDAARGADGAEDELD
jgi:hypothetical protein